MRLILLLILISFFHSAIAQEKYLFDTSKVNAKTKLIGRYPQYDKQKTFKSLNFIIEEPAKIKEALLLLKFGKEVKNSMQDPDFRICIVQGFEEIESYIVSPDLHKISNDGHTYEFDISAVQNFAKKNPFDYKFDIVPFKTKEDYKIYLENQYKDKAFLFDYPPQFKYEGSFEIKFPRNSKFASPKAISDYLTPLIEIIVKEDEYTLGYIIDERNLKDQSQFIMTISGSKKLFDKLQIESLKKENWTETAEEGWFFYRTK